MGEFVHVQYTGSESRLQLLFVTSGKQESILWKPKASLLLSVEKEV